MKDGLNRIQSLADEIEKEINKLEVKTLRDANNLYTSIDNIIGQFQHAYSKHIVEKRKQG